MTPSTNTSHRLAMLPSASALPRAKKCISSLALGGWDLPSEFSENGHLFHIFLDTGDDAGLPDDLRDRAMGINLDELPQGDREIAVTYNVRTGKAVVLGRLKNHRGYPVDDFPPEEGWVFGTADVVKVVDGRVIVWDFKTGLRDRVDPAALNLQLGFLVLAFARAYGLEAGEMGLCFIGWDGRVDCSDRAMVDAFALDCLAAELEELANDAACERARLVNGEEPRVRPGDHCRYCPARRAMTCPAWVTLVRELVSDPKLTGAQVSTLLTKDPDGALEKYALIRMVSEDLKAQMKSYATAHPQRLNDGRVYGEETKQQPVWDAIVTSEVVTELHGKEVARKLTAEISKAEIERALKPVIPFGKLAPVMKRVLEVITERGGRKHKEIKKVHAHKPAA